MSYAENKTILLVKLLVNLGVCKMSNKRDITCVDNVVVTLRKSRRLDIPEFLEDTLHVVMSYLGTSNIWSMSLTCRMFNTVCNSQVMRMVSTTPDRIGSTLLRKMCETGRFDLLNMAIDKMDSHNVSEIVTAMGRENFSMEIVSKLHKQRLKEIEPFYSRWISTEFKLGVIAAISNGCVYPSNLIANRINSSRISFGINIVLAYRKRYAATPLNESEIYRFLVDPLGHDMMVAYYRQNLFQDHHRKDPLPLIRIAFETRNTHAFFKITSEACEVKEMTLLESFRVGNMVSNLNKRMFEVLWCQGWLVHHTDILNSVLKRIHDEELLMIMIKSVEMDFSRAFLTDHTFLSEVFYLCWADERWVKLSEIIMNHPTCFVSPEVAEPIAKRAIDMILTLEDDVMFKYIMKYKVFRESESAVKWLNIANTMVKHCNPLDQ